MNVIAQIVRFKSRLTDEQVLRQYEARAPQYREMPGLVQKHYLRFTETGEYGAVYLWESEEALNAFEKTELRRTIPDAYEIVGASKIEKAEVVMVLHPERVPAKV
jgi:heme-degrading monooxygenase HmoA